MELIDGCIEFRDRAQALFRDSHGDHAPVVLVSIPLDETAFFQAIEEAGNVWIACNHSLADRSASEALPTRASENAKHVVLSAREGVLSKQRIQGLHQGVCGPHEV